MSNPAIDLDCKDIYYKLLHDKLPVQERLFIKNKSDTPYCKKESIRKMIFGPLPREVTLRPRIIVGGEVGTVLHTFTECKKVSNIWGWVRRTILKFLPHDWNALSNFEILYLTWPPYTNDTTIIWLLSQYISYVWTHDRDSAVNYKLEPFIGHLAFKFKKHSVTKRPKLHPIFFDPG